MVFRYLLVLLLLCLPALTSAAPYVECESALKSLFAEKVTSSQASNFLKIQSDLTIHRLAWAYLKAQKEDQSSKLENIERTILTLLDDKYTSSDADFIKAREAFESQPLSRAALADISPYLKEVLSQEYGQEAKPFLLNASDLKLLHTIAKFEKQNAVNGKFDSRMLARKSPQGMLNFAKIINASYKVSTTTEEDALGVELKLQGLEKTIGILQKRINDFLKDIKIPSQCLDEKICSEEMMDELFKNDEIVQKIFWDSLSDKLESDDLLLNNLTYGEIWLKVSNSSPGIVDNPSSNHASYPDKQKQVKTVIAGKEKISYESPVKGYYSSGTGLYIEDPIAVIVKDSPGRKAEGWKSFERPYLEKMADAILNDDKTFVDKGKIYSRKTGRQLSVEEAIKLMPPQKGSEFKKLLVSKDPKFISKQVSAMVNGDRSFQYGNGLYGVDGNPLNPAIIIAQEMTKKKGGKYEASRYQGMENGYLVARAEGLMNNRPHFKVGNQVYDTETGRTLTSPFRSLATTTDVKIDKQKRIQYQNLSDKETIINFHRDRVKKDGCQHYAIVDKKNANITVYTLAGVEVYKKEVLIGVKASDERTKWTEYNDITHQGSYTTGAGAFTIAPPKTGSYYSKNFNNNILQIEGQSVFAIHQIPNGLGKRYQYFGTGNPEDRRVSQGCVNMRQSEFVELTKWMKPTCHVYVLPEEENNKFVVKDGKLEFLSTTTVVNANNYNYTKSKSIYKPIDIKITNPAGVSKDSLPFVKALEDEKEKLMKIFNLNNDDYNDLASLSYAIMGNESDFGRSTKYWIKEHDQGDVILAKAAKRLFEGKNPFDKSVTNTSRGFTQIKELPDGAWKKSYPNINKETLGDPKNSAVATMAYLVDAVKILKRIASENAKDPRKVKITKENLVDYLGYIYQGRKGALKSATDPANADFNTYVQKLRKHMSYIEIAQKIE